MKMKNLFVYAALVSGILCFSWQSDAAVGEIKISADYPGGNVIVQKNEPGKAEIAPDLRGGKPWFYWNFEAEAVQPGRVDFLLPGTLMMVAKGSAVSVDGGKTWQWINPDCFKFASPAAKDVPANPRDSFYYEFKDKGQKVRFAVAIPYQQADLDEFLKKNASNPNLTKSVLTKTTKGLPIDLIQIGKPGEGVKAVLLTARNHACEAMASYVLEGFLQELLSDSAFGVEFRKKYVVYAVPIVDKEGVQAGDQGKGRNPHDHNRDYGQTNIYPEVKAIQDLADAKNVEFFLDFHCPAVRGDVHEMFYFDGTKVPHIYENNMELVRWMTEERPPAITSWEGVYLKPAKDPAPVEGLPSAIYFAARKGMIFAATLESPYAQTHTPLDVALAREYGKSLLRAWTRTEFITGAAESARTENDNAKFVEFQKSFKGSPADMEKIAADCLANEKTPALYRIEANNRLGAVKLRQTYTDSKKYQEAFDCYELATKDPNATNVQKSTALTQRAVIVCRDPVSTPEKVEEHLGEFMKFTCSSPTQQFDVYGSVSLFYETKQKYDRTMEYAKKQLPVATNYEKGRVLNKIADIYDLMKQNDKAIETRKEAVAFLRGQLVPVVPTGVFGPLMAADLLDDLNGIPSSTAEEKKEAANMALTHKVCPPDLKNRVLKALGETEPGK
jgi:tetratricopeptide (TPR) repeat protein